MTEEIIKIQNLSEFQKWVTGFAAELKMPSLILLDGPMGAGKTEFVKVLVQSMGGKGVSSPTFTFHQEYNAKGRKIHHFDLYRCESDADVESTGVWDVLAFSSDLVIVEWSEKIKSSNWPSKWHVVNIQIQVQAGEERIINVCSI